jgi:hypothetical protein
MEGACSTHGRDNKCIHHLVGKSEGKISEDTGVDGRIILEWILKECWKLWTGNIYLSTGTSGGLL